jgi:hypothetical protein
MRLRHVYLLGLTRERPLQLCENLRLARPSRGRDEGEGSMGLRPARRVAVRYVALFAVLTVCGTGVLSAQAHPFSAPPRLNGRPSATVDPAPAGHRQAHALPSLFPTAPDALARALRAGRLNEAHYALARAESLFHRTRVAKRFGSLMPARRLDATMILRDLSVRLRSLSGKALRRGQRILARPTQGSSDPGGDGYSVPALSSCTTDVCVYWVPTTDDAPDLTDANANAIPDWVEQTSAVFENVWATEVGTYGYRAPESDLTSLDHGVDGRLDVYLADIGDQGFYGYCTTDDPKTSDPTYKYWDASAYCVVDDDFSPDEFSTGANGLDALEVTAAHEFFHAVQFAYDELEDNWFMESTATWMEDEVYTDVNDNLQYLPSSPLRQPGVPLDYGSRKFTNMYGAWIWWRFLEEYLGTNGVPDPTIVRTTWEFADGSPGGSDDYSTQAIQSALKTYHWDVRSAFRDFGVWNAVPDNTYSEGGSYPSPKASVFTVSATKPATGWKRFALDHLTTGYALLRPGQGVAGSAKLRLSVDGPKYKTGSEASAIVLLKSGKQKYYTYSLDADGDGSLTVPFGATVDSVFLILSNASTRFTCWKKTVYSCQGKPKDDGWYYYFDASLD